MPTYFFETVTAVPEAATDTLKFRPDRLPTMAQPPPGVQLKPNRAARRAAKRAAR